MNQKNLDKFGKNENYPVAILATEGSGDYRLSLNGMILMKPFY
jgi:hypothetical protein